MLIQVGVWEVGSDRSNPKFGKRYFLFRAGAILIGLLPFLLFELTLQAIGWQQPDGIRDPYVGFANVRPLFEKNLESGRYEISQTRYPLFRPDSFSIDKPENEFRVFCLGGSTVQGRPFAIETAFSTWLEISLQVADPSKQWRVVNCGGVSYASYRLAPIVDEIMEYEPDLLILYTGQNEFLEDRTYDSIKTASPWVVQTHERLSSFKTYSFLRNCFVRQGEPDPKLKTELPSEVEARLDFRDGLSQYNRDDAWKKDVVQHFEHNLRRMIKKAEACGVPVILCNPVCNLRDAAPFKSQNGDLSNPELKHFEESLTAITSRESLQANGGEEVAQLRSLVELDPRHADAQFRLGQAYLRIGDTEQARRHLIMAKEEDVCPLRMIEPMYVIIENVRRDYNIPLVDLKAFFEQRAVDGIPGRESLVDHVHPSIHGHQLIAGLLLDEMVAGKMVKLTDDFAIAKEVQFEAHLESLPYMYFELGKDRLAGLKRWSEGRVTREKKSPEK